MTKKIAIVTWLGNGNFGTSLQSYALHQKLVVLGYNVSFLPFFPESFGLKSYIKVILSKLGFLQWNKKRKYGKTMKMQKLYTFHLEKYNLSEIYTKDQYKRLLSHTDVFLTGSDQIWNAWYSFCPFYYLSFARDSKRVAYASSLGTSSLPQEYKEEIKKYLSKFSYIGVREQSAVNVLSELLQRRDIVQVLDPTFLLSVDDWISLGNESFIEFELPEKYILCYLIGNNDFYKKQLLDVKGKLDIQNIIIIPAVENKSFSIDGARIYADAGPKEFIHLIRNASLVCTDSFHATAISINLSVNFVEFIRFNDADLKSQNSRIYDLLNHYGLQDCLYLKDSDLWHNSISYSTVQDILKKDREFSMNYLVAAIES